MSAKMAFFLSIKMAYFLSAKMASFLSAKMAFNCFYPYYFIRIQPVEVVSGKSVKKPRETRKDVEYCHACRYIFWVGSFSVTRKNTFQLGSLDMVQKCHLWLFNHGTFLPQNHMPLRKKDRESFPSSHPLVSNYKDMYCIGAVKHKHVKYITTTTDAQ